MSTGDKPKRQFKHWKKFVFRNSVDEEIEEAERQGFVYRLREEPLLL